MELEGRAEELRERGLGIAVISYDPQEATRAFSDEQNISFPLLSDVGSETIRRFELLNPVAEWALGPDSDDPAVAADVATYVSIVNPNERMIGIAFPGTFILDPDGRVSSRFFEDSYIERNTVSSIVMRLGDSMEPVAAVRISTAQMDLTTYPSDAEVAIGNRFSLMLAVEPHENMHVYAPGASGYRVIRLDVEPLPYLSVLPMEYPESTTYYFEPFDEYVPIYEEPFTLVQEVLLEGNREAQQTLRQLDEVTINGSLEYQACSDTICYPPQTVPLSWTMPLRPLLFGPPRRQN